MLAYNNHKIAKINVILSSLLYPHKKMESVACTPRLYASTKGVDWKDMLRLSTIRGETPSKQ